MIVPFAHPQSVATAICTLVPAVSHCTLSVGSWRSSTAVAPHGGQSRRLWRLCISDIEIPISIFSSSIYEKFHRCSHRKASEIEHVHDIKAAMHARSFLSPAKAESGRCSGQELRSCALDLEMQPALRLPCSAISIFLLRCDCFYIASIEICDFRKFQVFVDLKDAEHAVARRPAEA